MSDEKDKIKEVTTIRTRAKALREQFDPNYRANIDHPWLVSIGIDETNQRIKFYVSNIDLAVKATIAVESEYPLDFIETGHFRLIGSGQRRCSYCNGTGISKYSRPRLMSNDSFDRKCQHCEGNGMR